MNEVGIPAEKIQKRAQEYREQEFFNPSKVTGSISTCSDQKLENNIKEFSSKKVLTLFLS
jgi:hypothetical protein